MALKKRGNSGRKLSQEWHRVREEARRSLGSFEFGPVDTERYDLDEIDFDRKMRDAETDPRVENEGSPKSGNALAEDDPVRD